MNTLFLEKCFLIISILICFLSFLELLLSLLIRKIETEEHKKKMKKKMINKTVKFINNNFIVRDPDSTENEECMKEDQDFTEKEEFIEENPTTNYSDDAMIERLIEISTDVMKERLLKIYFNDMCVKHQGNKFKRKTIVKKISKNIIELVKNLEERRENS